MAHIVVIDSDSEVARVLAEFFRAAGHRCGVARSKRVAQRFLRYVRPDLLIIECLLSDGDGFELARLAAKLGVPAIIMSTNLDRAREAERAGFAYLQKPFGLAALSAAVAAALGGEGAWLAGDQPGG